MLTLLRNARVFAPESLGTLDLLIGGERILWMGERFGQFPATVDVTVVDFDGLVLVPGLVDGHAHLTGGGGEAGPQSRVPAPLLSRYTRAGVTTAIGVLGTDDVTRNTGDLIVCARGLIAEGLSCWCHTGGYHVPPVTLTGTIRGDIAYIDLVIGVGEIAMSDHRSSQPTLDELLRIAADAHVGGLMTGKAGILHLHVGDGARGLEPVRRAIDISEIPARVFNPTHVNRRRELLKEAIGLARSGCYVDISAFEVEPGGEGWDAADALERYWESGAPLERVTVSSDSGGSLPVFDTDGRIARVETGNSEGLLVAIRKLLSRGHALDQILPPFTSNPATLLRLPRKGRLETGSDADIVVLDERYEVHSVMARGAWHVKERETLRYGMFEDPHRD